MTIKWEKAIKAKTAAGGFLIEVADQSIMIGGFTPRTPQEARELAQALIEAADMLDPAPAPASASDEITHVVAPPVDTVFHGEVEPTSSEEYYVRDCDGDFWKYVPGEGWNFRYKRSVEFSGSRDEWAYGPGRYLPVTVVDQVNACMVVTD